MAIQKSRSSNKSNARTWSHSSCGGTSRSFGNSRSFVRIALHALCKTCKLYTRWITMSTRTLPHRQVPEQSFGLILFLLPAAKPKKSTSSHNIGFGPPIKKLDPAFQRCLAKLCAVGWCAAHIVLLSVSAATAATTQASNRLKTNYHSYPHVPVHHCHIFLHIQRVIVGRPTDLPSPASTPAHRPSPRKSSFEQPTGYALVIGSKVFILKNRFPVLTVSTKWLQIGNDSNMFPRAAVVRGIRANLSAWRSG